MGNALRTRGGITRPGRAEAVEAVEAEAEAEEPMVHAETAPVLDRTITEPLPAVQEEDHDRPFSPLMTPKASHQASHEASHEASQEASQEASHEVAEVVEVEAEPKMEPKEDEDEDVEDVEDTTAPEELDDGYLS